MSRRFTGNHDDMDIGPSAEDAWDEFYSTKCRCGARMYILAVQCDACDDAERRAEEAEAES